MKNKDIIKVKQKATRNADKEKTNKKQQDYIQRKKMNTTSEARILAFKREIVEGPNFTCYSCKRRLFKAQVKILKKENILKLQKRLNKKIFRQIGLQFKRS